MLATCLQPYNPVVCENGRRSANECSGLEPAPFITRLYNKALCNCWASGLTVQCHIIHRSGGGLFTGRFLVQIYSISAKQVAGDVL